MAYKLIMTVIAIIALAMAILSVTFNRDMLTVVVIVSRFFEVMIPILAVGGLIKWIFFHCGSKSCDKN